MYTPSSSTPCSSHRPASYPILMMSAWFILSPLSLGWQTRTRLALGGGNHRTKLKFRLTQVTNSAMLVGDLLQPLALRGVRFWSVLFDVMTDNKGREAFKFV